MLYKINQISASCHNYFPASQAIGSSITKQISVWFYQYTILIIKIQYAHIGKAYRYLANHNRITYDTVICKVHLHISADKIIL